MLFMLCQHHLFGFLRLEIDLIRVSVCGYGRLECRLYLFGGNTVFTFVDSAAENFYLALHLIARKRRILFDENELIVRLA